MARADLTETKYVSTAFEAIWGYSVEELYRDPKRFVEAIHPEDRAGFIATLQTHQKHGRTRFSHEYRIIRPDGELRWIWDQGFPIVESDGSINDFIGIAQDVTRRKKLELELMKAQALESVGLMAGQLAHDFNNLLGVIAMNASYIKRRTEPDGAASDAVDAIVEASRRGSAVIKALLSAARRQRLTPTIFDLVEAVHGSKSLFAAIGDRHPLHFATSVSRLMVKADRPALEQALLNLVLNSADAMPDGGAITLRVRHASIDEAADHDLSAGPFAVVEVCDTGTGMTNDVIRSATEPFFTTKGEVGTGLGLPAVSGFASQSGGRLVIQSKPGEGSRVSIFLPVHVVSQLSARHALPHRKERARAVQRVLLVDDDDALRRIIASQLVDEGYVVLEAAAGELALRTMAEQRVDVIVSDIMLKGMNGWELRRRVQRLFGKPVILMTGYAIEEETSDPDVEILPKPFPLELLVSAIERRVAAA
jgi:PAS domain S-box-containing protein